MLPVSHPHHRAPPSLRARLSSGDGFTSDDAASDDDGAGLAPSKACPPSRRAAWWRGAAAGAAAALAGVAVAALLVCGGRAAPPASGGLSAPAAPLAHPAEARDGAGWLPRDSWPGEGGAAGSARLPSSPAPLAPSPTARLLVSYAYFEKDEGQASNLAFFAAVGMGAPPPAGGGGAAPSRPFASSPSATPPPPHTDFVVTVAGDACTPCASFASRLAPDPRGEALAGVAAAWTGPGYGPPADPGALALVHRTANTGLDLASHNVSLTFAAARVTGAGASGEGVASALASLYAFFFFVNSSARGPFLPAYLPPSWSWPVPFTSRLTGRVRLASAALVCLPPTDAGGPGPRAESWAFALTPAGLADGVGGRAFDAGRTCKLCAGAEEGVVVGGEYGLSRAVLAAGGALATLMLRYDPRVDWADPAHWTCNDGAHASRAGTHGGVSMHPLETVFVKASWGVGEPYTSAYARWLLVHAGGGAGTEGRYDEAKYRWAISAEAVAPPRGNATV